MNMSKILPAIVLGAASLSVSTTLMAGDLFTGIGNATTSVVRGVGNATTYVVDGVVHGTKYVTHGVVHTTKAVMGRDGKVHYVRQ